MTGFILLYVLQLFGLILILIVDDSNEVIRTTDQLFLNFIPFYWVYSLILLIYKLSIKKYNSLK